MKTLLFIIISLISGIMAGEILACINLFIVEPTTDKAIGYELQKDMAKGEKVDFGEVNSYRIWQKSGTFARCCIYRNGIWRFIGNCLCIR